ncbi:MAG: carboxypeptidase-like regulatory domain-containing protein, partial [Bacteroidales bacterium]|nr:carboxypeptidase-like regulatory domain-containing protein [Bacteroidales bacterium]
MKTFTRISILVLVMLISSAVVFAQNNASKTTISQEELKMMQENKVNPFPNAGGDQDFLATPITSFPYFQNFESGSMPPEFDPQPGAQAGVRISATGGYSSDWGLLSEGGSSTGWGSTPYSYAAAFDPSKASHFGTTVIDVVPNGSPGTLKLQFQLGIGYSFNSNYSWFRVLLDGSTALTDLNTGNYYWKATTHWTGSQWVELEFDLSAYDGAPFSLSLQSSCKYYEGYYNEGDFAVIDNVKVWYELPPGDLEGYVMNGGGLSIGGATVGIEEFGSTTTDATGYYMLAGAPGGNQTVYAWKQGYNLVYQPTYVAPASLTQQDIILTAPTMFISPTFHEYTLNPEEYFTTQTGIINTGD